MGTESHKCMEQKIKDHLMDDRQAKAHYEYLSGLPGPLTREFEHSNAPTEPYIPNPISWPDPTEEMRESAEFEAIWQCIKSWDINVPGAYIGYTGATGNHVRAILDALAGCQCH